MIAGYDVVRLTPAGPITEHYAGKLETDGPWLIAYRVNDETVAELIAPAHAVVSCQPCPGDGRCGTDGG